MDTPVIEFFWDAASPYTYLAAMQVDVLAARHGGVVHWKPFLLGKVFEATGNRMPASVPAKGKYLFDDLRLWARYYGTPFKFPDVFPVASLTAMRIACAVPEADIGTWAKAVMAAYWTNNDDIGQPEVLRQVADGLGWDGAALLEKTKDPAVKDKLRANTDEAISRGVFGAPTFFIGDRMFWGNDRFPLMDDILAGRLS